MSCIDEGTVGSGFSSIKWWKTITSEGVLKEILESEETKLSDDLKLVLNYLRGYLEKIMDSPELILEMDELKKEISELKRENRILRNSMISINNELGSIKRDNIMIKQRYNLLESIISELYEKLT